MSETRLEFNDEQGRRVIHVDKDLLTIGRRAENDLQLTGKEVSREHAELFKRDGNFVLRDKESRYGTFINGERISSDTVLSNLDRIRFGNTDPELLFISQTVGAVERVTDLAVGDLRQMSSLLEGLRAMSSSRVLEEVLAVVLDSALDVSGAERGFIMLADTEGNLEFKLGRGRGRRTLSGTVFKTSRRIPEQVFFSGQPQIVMDMLEGDWAGQHGETIAMGIRNVLCVPLRLMRFAERQDSSPEEERRIGVLYLDSTVQGTLGSTITQTALETLATEAAVAIENTKLYREALEKARMEQEMSIAAEMQQSLLPPRRRTPAATPQQQPAFMGPCANLACEIQNGWSRNNVMIYGLAGAMPEDKFNYKPTPAQQSFGERVLHAAQVNLMLLQALGAKTPAPAVDTNATSKAASMAALQRVSQYGVAVVKELGEQGLVARIDAPGPMGFFMGPQSLPGKPLIQRPNRASVSHQ